MLKVNRHLNIKNDSFVAYPKVILVRKFSETSLEEFTKDFIHAESTGQEIIPIQIDSYGGAVDALLGMLDIIGRSNKKICTFTNTKAASCGSLLLASGTKGYRFASQNAYVMVHEISAGTYGKYSELMNDADFYTKLNEKLLAMLNSFTGNKKGFFEDQLFQNGNADIYYSASQAAKVGLVDKVKSPSFEIEIIQKFKLL